MKDETISTRNGMNEITRLEYVKDCNIGVTRWNMGDQARRRGLRAEAAVDALPPRRWVLGRF